MTKKQPIHVLIAAAGTGERFGSDVPKQYTRIGSKTVLRHTLENVLSWPGISSVRVIIDPKHAKLYQDAVSGLELADPVEGGKERNISINNALKNLSKVNNEDIILVHDAARPLVEQKDVARLLDALRDNRAATLSAPVSDTLRHAENDIAGDIVDRNTLSALQTPQGFRFSDLKKAHEAANENAEYTDDTSLLSLLGIPVKLVEGSRSNIKITAPEDLRMAEALLAQPPETRTGTGFDVHAFDPDKAGPVRLCGIDIDHPQALTGHSDADVGLHALTDAILGAIGGGDIGRHFPPSDDTFKDMDSRIFLERAVELLEARGGSVQNLDLTLICEAPKIGPHAEDMRYKIAEITRIVPESVNVKATTTEGLGFTGRGEGIAAQAIATVKLFS